jgi:hypothetical protein
MTPSHPENTKTAPQTGGSSYFLNEKSPEKKSIFFIEKNL